MLEHLFLFPGEWLGIFVVGSDESIDVLLELVDVCKGSAGQRLALRDGEPCLHLVEP